MSNQEVFRAFVAIDFPHETKTKIYDLINWLRNQIPLDIKWVLLKKLHLTLKFLGNISLVQQELLTREVERELKTIQPFTLTFPEIVWFPCSTNPRALVLRPDPTEQLFCLAKILDEQALHIGIQPENRAYQPHLTLGKLYDCVPTIPKGTLPDLHFTVSAITLFRSDFINYTTLQRFQL